MALDPTYVDGDYSEAAPCTLPVFEKPFADQGINIDYILRQDWYQNLADYTPLALDTPHPDYPDFLLVSEGPQTDLGGGVIQWQRTYAKVPASFARNDGSYAYNFIGFAGVLPADGVNPTYRPAKTWTVPLQITRDFFNTTDPDTDIPVIQPQKYYWAGYPDSETIQLYDAPPYTLASVPSRTAYEAMIAAGDYLVVETSSYRVWLGNIYLRETRRVLAQ